jgi:hypothetical protein
MATTDVNHQYLCFVIQQSRVCTLDKRLAYPDHLPQFFKQIKYDYPPDRVSFNKLENRKQKKKTKQNKSTYFMISSCNTEESETLQ